MTSARSVVIFVLLFVVAAAVLSRPAAPDHVEPFLDTLAEDAIAPKYLRALDFELMRVVTGAFLSSIAAHVKTTGSSAVKPKCRDFINAARTAISDKVKNARLVGNRQTWLASTVDEFAKVVLQFILTRHCAGQSKDGFINDVDELKADLTALHNSLAEPL